MKNIVITGSARGLGLEMAKVFIKSGNNVVISDVNIENLEKSAKSLEGIASDGNVYACTCDVTNYSEIENLISFSLEKMQTIDIWINNAGVNQPDLAIWELSQNDISKLIDIDLKGTVYSSNAIMKYFDTNKKGAIYNVEGYGSNDAKMLGLSIYGTSKRAVTYFTEALAKECETRGNNVIVGKLSPGIMITDFITNSLGNGGTIELSEKTKKVYNILGDYPDVVADFLVKGMLKNTKNNAKIEWLTTSKAMKRFIFAGFNKRDFFKALGE